MTERGQMAVRDRAQGLAEARRRIVRCVETRSDTLDLGGLMLTAVPAELYRCTWLKRLYLGADAEAREEPQLLINDAGQKALERCNALGVLPGALFDALGELAVLDLAHNGLTSLPPEIAGLTALTRLDLARNDLGADGARHLAGLTALTRLDLWDNRIGDAGARHLAGLTALTRLGLAGNDLGADGARHLAGLTALTDLDLWDNRIGADGARHLAGLIALTRLDLARNDLGADGARHLAGLTALTSLDLGYNGLGADGARHLAGLTALTRLGLGYNRIGADGARHLAGLTALTSLDLGYNDLGADGARHLAGLTALTRLGLARNDLGADGARHLAGLTALTDLDLWDNRIGADGARHLAGLTALTRLGLARNDLGADGARHLAGLTALTSLDLWDNGLGADGARHLAGLTALTRLDLGHNGLEVLSPLVGLPRLERLVLSGCRADGPYPELWAKPTLREVIFEPGRLPGVPAVLLSTNSYTDNCLPRLRAHFADLADGGAPVGDVKVMLLGNGRVGKTKIARRLRGEPYGADDEPSTHGVQVTSARLEMPGGAPVVLRLWDFGGQDIYHGTHALFLKSSAIFPIVWTPAAEAAREHTHGGFTFRNQPLAYWLAYVRQMGGENAQILLIQAQADSRADERQLDPKLLEDFEPRPVELAYSARQEPPRNHGRLTDALVDAVSELRHREGEVRIGRGRAWVKAELERIVEREQARPKPERRLQLVPRANFAAACQVAREEGHIITSDAHLLEYLHNIGTVFYREGLFGDQIILDQQWALDAVYAVFDREKGAYRDISANRGRFRRADLAASVWGEHSSNEQKLFLSFMVQCGICFEMRPGDENRGIEPEYIAPDLLPAADDEHVEVILRKWGSRADAEGERRYPFLAHGLMRSLMSKVGAEAGIYADYWRDGFTFYDAATQANAKVWQAWDKDAAGEEAWTGSIRVTTRDGDAATLMQRVLAVIDEVSHTFGARAEAATEGDAPEARAAIAEAGSAVAMLQLVLAPASQPEWCVSYAWGDDASTEGRTRERLVEEFCRRAAADGIEIIRDTSHMRSGDSIIEFARRIGRAERVFIFLSNEYLQRWYCMLELFEVWKRSGQDGRVFNDKARVFVMPGVTIMSELDRLPYAAFWKKRFDEFDRMISGPRRMLVSPAGFNEYCSIREFHLKTTEILAHIQDTLTPRTFDVFVREELAVASPKPATRR